MRIKEEREKDAFNDDEDGFGFFSSIFGGDN
jgi:hypothetical protein